MADIQYLNYGDLQIEQLALLNNLANEVPGYVQKLPWSNKRKLKFMSAYSDIMTRGIGGASNSTGLWVIDVKGPINFNSDEDREIYQEAAYFILQQMAKLPVKPKEEVQDKSNLTLFDNEYFNKTLNQHINSEMSGGNPMVIGDGEEDLWNYQDERGENGLRGIRNRSLKLASLLESYKNKLDFTKFNFEDSPYGSAEEFNLRLDRAIAALKNTPEDASDDREALNQLGINNPSKFFSTGATDPFTKGDYTGTYGDYYQNYLPNQEKLKQQQITLKRKIEQQKFNQTKFNSGTRFGLKLSGKTRTELANKYKNDEGLISQLNNYLMKDTLTADEQSEILGAYKFYNETGRLQQLTRDELLKFKGLKGYQNLAPNDLKKLPGVEGFYFDTRSKTMLKAGRADSIIGGNLNLEQLGQYSEEALLQKEKSRKIFEDGLTAADIADISGALTDIVGVGVTFAPVVGNAVGAATGLFGSLQHFVGDALRDGLDWGDAGRLALNAGFDLATLIPGLGTAAKAGKVAKALAPWVPRIIATIGAYQGIKNGKEIINSFTKLSNPSTITVQDLLNISQGIALIAGGINVTRGEILQRKINKNSEKEHIVTTEKKQEVKLNETEYKTIKDKKATREAKQQALESAAKRLDIKLNNDGLVYKGRSITHPFRSKEKSVDVDNVTSKPSTNININISDIRRKDKEWLSKNRWATKFLPGKTLDSKLNWTNRGMFTRGLKEETPTTRTETPTRTTTSSTETSTIHTETPTTSVKTGETYGQLWKKIHKGEHSGNALSEEPFDINGFNFNIDKNPGLESGNIDITFNGNNTSIPFNNQKDLMKKVHDYMKKNKIKIDVDGKSKVDVKKMGEVLLKLKEKGVFKQGGVIDKLRIQRYKNFIKR